LDSHLRVPFFEEILFVCIRISHRRGNSLFEFKCFIT